MLGGDFTVVDYLLWNEIPTVLGNLVGGLALVGIVIYVTHGRTRPSRSRATKSDPAATEDISVVERTGAQEAVR